MKDKFRYAEGRISDTIQFITGEMEAFQEHFKDITWQKYRLLDIVHSRAAERMVENILTALIELAGTICIRKNRSVDSYSSALKEAALALGFEESESEMFSKLAVYRNKLAHRYLDIKWDVLKRYMENQHLIKRFLQRLLETK